MTRASLFAGPRFPRAAVAASFSLAVAASAAGLAPCAAAGFESASNAAGRGPGAAIVSAGVARAGAVSGAVSAVPDAATLAPALARRPVPAFNGSPSVSLGLPAGAPRAVAAALSAENGVPPLPPSAVLSSPRSAPVRAVALAVSRAAVPRRSAAGGRVGAAPVRDGLARTVRDLESASGADAMRVILDRLFGNTRIFSPFSEPAASASASRPLAHAAPGGAPAAARATPPSLVVQVSDGLNPGARLLAGALDSLSLRAFGPDALQLLVVETEMVGQLVAKRQAQLRAELARIFRDVFHVALVQVDFRR